MNALDILVTMKTIPSFFGSRVKNTNNMCFLCYKLCDKPVSLYEIMEIQDENLDLNITLFNIMNILFPTHEIILNQACESCTNVILKIFILIQQSCFLSDKLHCLINSINSQIDEKTLKENNKAYQININLVSPILNNKNTINSETENKINCSECNMKFNSKENLQNHTKLSHMSTNKAKICDTCGKSFKNHSVLKSHMNCHKKKPCPICGKILKTHPHFELHVKSHTSPVKKKLTLYNCDSCDYRTLSKNSLEGHINNYHLKIRPHKCNSCPKAFYQNSNLREHLETHKEMVEKVKKVCETCGDTFISEKTLFYHRKLHAGIKDYKCTYCDLKFVNTSRRLEHVKRKHMPKTECCNFCDKKFSIKSDLKRHLRKIHCHN